MHSTDVRKHLRQRIGHHPAAVRRHRALPHAVHARQGVYTLLPDTQPSEAAYGGVLPGE